MSNQNWNYTTPDSGDGKMSSKPSQAQNQGKQPKGPSGQLVFAEEAETVQSFSTVQKTQTQPNIRQNQQY